MLWLLLLASLICALSVSFDECDTDASRLLTKIELRDCFDREYGADTMNVESLVGLFDRNGDGGISSSEYRLVLENMRDTTLDGEVQNDGEFGEDATTEVDIELRDGTVRTIQRDEFFHMNQARMEEQQAEQQGMTSNDEEDINTLKMKNPELGRFIEMAQWAKKIMEEHYSSIEGNKGNDAHFPANSTIYELRSLPAGGSKNRGKESDTEITTPAVTGKFELYFEMSILSPKGMKKKGEKQQDVKPADAPLARHIRKYEFHLIGDPALYRLPHAIVAGCWELGDNGLRVDKLLTPAPRRYPTKDGEGGGGGVDVSYKGAIFALIPALWRAMNTQQRVVAIFGLVFFILLLLFFVVLPAINFFILMQLKEEDVVE